MHKLNIQKGSTMMEYAIALSMVIGVFLVGAQILHQTGIIRRDKSMVVVEDIVPCGADLSGQACY